MKNILQHILLLLLALLAGGALHASKDVPNIQKFPVLLVEFEDVKFSVANPKECFASMLNTKGYNVNGATGSVADYFNDNFGRHSFFEFVVSDVISLPFPIAHFGSQSTNSNDSNVRDMVLRACTAALDSSFNFAQFCKEGETAVKNVSIIYAGYSEAEGGDPNSIWPHQNNMESAPLALGEYRIYSYTCTAELKGSQGDTIAPIGPFCHEFSHFLGLPDLYDTNGDNEGLSPALYGSLSIMDNGHFLNNGNTPPYFNSIEREILGLGTIEDLLPDSSYTIHPVNETEKIYRIKSHVEGEYFLLEFRKRAKWDKHIGGEGLVVYHVDKSNAVYAGLSCMERWQYNNINSFSGHECARVMTAAGDSCGISGVFFPGPKNTDELLSYRGNTLLRDWNGYAIGIGLKNITLQGGKLSFKTVRDFSFNDTLPQAVDCRITPYQKDARIEWRGIEPRTTEGPMKTHWLISWREEGSDISHSFIADTNSCIISGLEPGKEHYLEVRCITDREFGKITSHSFSTHPQTSPYPYIFIHKELFRVGNTIDLRLFNLPEDVRYTHWHINGVKLEKPQITLQESGEIVIKAGIGYTDGSYETITKTIVVR